MPRPGVEYILFLELRSFAFLAFASSEPGCVLTQANQSYCFIEHKVRAQPGCVLLGIDKTGQVLLLGSVLGKVLIVLSYEKEFDHFW